MNIIDIRKETVNQLGLVIDGTCDECHEQKMDCVCDDPFKFLDLTDREVFEAFSCEDCEELITNCTCSDEITVAEEIFDLEDSSDDEEDICPQCEESYGFCQCEEKQCDDCGKPLSVCECNE